MWKLMPYIFYGIGSLSFLVGTIIAIVNIVKGI